MAYGGSTHPALLAAIRRLDAPDDAKAVLLATTWAEAGGRLDAVGDNGKSHGPYQEYDHGRGAGIPIAQRRDPVASTQRAWNEYQNYYNKGARGGELAYRAQRPADQQGYINKVNSYLDEARKVLGQGGSSAALPQTGNPASPATGAAQNESPQSGNQGLLGSIGVAIAGRQKGQSFFDSVVSGAMNARLYQQSNPQDETGMAGAAARRQGHEGHDHGEDAGGPLPPPGKTKFTPGGGPEAHHSRALGNWQSDDAYDIMGKAGDPVYSPVGGVVTKISGQPGGNPGFAGYGITVKTPQGELFFKHLGTAKVRVGQKFGAGTLLGTLDAATAGGPHIHLGGTNRAQLDNIYKWYVGGR